MFPDEPLGAPLMDRLAHLNALLREFEATIPDGPRPPLACETVWHHSWSPEHTLRFNRATSWRAGTGIYLFVDFCAADDIHGSPIGPDERFSVIRRIGKAGRQFADRMNMYCHRVKADLPRMTWWKDGTGEYREWFRYAQIDVVVADKGTARALELYLLARVPTECNHTDVPEELRGRPLIYDAGQIKVRTVRTP